MSDDKPTEEKRKRGGSKPGRRLGPNKNPAKPPKTPKGDPHPNRKGSYEDDQYR